MSSAIKFKCRPPVMLLDESWPPMLLTKSTSETDIIGGYWVETLFFGGPSNNSSDGPFFVTWTYFFDAHKKWQMSGCEKLYTPYGLVPWHRLIFYSTTRANTSRFLSFSQFTYFSGMVQLGWKKHEIQNTFVMIPGQRRGDTMKFYAIVVIMKSTTHKSK